MRNMKAVYLVIVCSSIGVITCTALGTGEKNYPWATRMTNTYDVGLHDAVTDDEYLSTLAEWLPRLLQRHRPQLVFFQAGVDAMAKDSFGRCVALPSCWTATGKGEVMTAGTRMWARHMNGDIIRLQRCTGVTYSDRTRHLQQPIQSNAPHARQAVPHSVWAAEAKQSGVWPLPGCWRAARHCHGRRVRAIICPLSWQSMQRCMVWTRAQCGSHAPCKV